MQEPFMSGALGWRSGSLHFGSLHTTRWTRHSNSRPSGEGAVSIDLPASHTKEMQFLHSGASLPVELSSLEGYVAFPRSKFTIVGEFATFNGVSPLLLS